MSATKGPRLGARHLQSLLLFLAILVNYASRLNVSISLVAMTNAKTTNTNFHEFDWDEKQKSYILSSFFWGYTLMQLPGAYAARRIGVKRTLLIGTFADSILGLSVPFCVFWGGWKILCVIRFLQGLSQAALFPSVYQHLANWSPVEERNRIGTLSHSGLECGTIVGMYVTGIVAASELGWPGIYYFFSGIGIVFSLLWLIFAENNPNEAKFITAVERSYILNSQASVGDDQITENLQIPWKAILKSRPFISFTVMGLCNTWGFVTMLTEIPAYLHGVLKMDISNNAFYSALPYAVMLMFSYVSMILADVVLKNKWTSLLMLRKIFNIVAMLGPAALLLGIGFLNENQKTLSITFITLSVGFNGAITIGGILNLIDMSPNHTCILMAVFNSLANITAVICPIVVGIVVYDETQRSQWQVIFILTAILFILGNLQFLVFAQTDTQPWNDKDFMTKLDTERGIRLKKTTATNS